MTLLLSSSIHCTIWVSGGDCTLASAVGAARRGRLARRAAHGDAVGSQEAGERGGGHARPGQPPGGRPRPRLSAGAPLAVTRP